VPDSLLPQVLACAPAALVTHITIIDPGRLLSKAL